MNRDVIEWKERCQILCSCKKDTVVFFCKEASCPNNTNQPVFCLGCIEDSHFHKPLCYISNEIAEIAKEWNVGKASL